MKQNTRKFPGFLVLFIFSVSLFASDFHVEFDKGIKIVPEGVDVTATYHGKMNFIKGRRGNALLMAKEGMEKLALASPGPLLPQNGAVELWLRPINWNGITEGELLEICLKLDSGKDVLIYKESSNLVCVFRNESNVVVKYSPIYDWKENQWQHVMVNRDDSGVNVYINGHSAAERISQKRDSKQHDFETCLKYGMVITAGARTTIDELRMYEEAFTRDRIESHYIESRLMRKNYLRPRIVIPYASEKPLSDGGINVDAYKNAATVTDFINISDRRLFPLQTSVRLMYDKNHLYMLYKSPVPNEGLSGGPRARDHAGDGSDEIEFFAFTEYTETYDFYQFIGNPWGSEFDAMGGTIINYEWDGDWLYRSEIIDGWWYAELWINDFDGITEKRPDSGTEWLVNFCRNWRSGLENWTQWSHTVGGYHRPLHFGTMVFGDKQTIIPQIETIADVSDTENSIAAVFSLINSHDVARDVRMAYSLYPEGDYLPSERKTLSKKLEPREAVQTRMVCDLNEIDKGMVELQIIDGYDGRVLFYQMVGFSF